MPSSKTKDDSEYDDRLLKVLEILKANHSDLDSREILDIKQSRVGAHLPTTENRPTVQDHINSFELKEKLGNPLPETVVIFDDIITTGASFKAAKIFLQTKFKNVIIIGIFIGRTIHNFIQND